jgi:hypothetical protein
MVIDILPRDETLQDTGCCRVTEDGAQICDVSLHQQGASCGCQTVPVSEVTVVQLQPPHRARILWQDVRSGVMFGFACAASPCCTPLIVPAVVALLAGTPLSLWITAHLGWVYGALTLLSAVSLFFALRWLNKDRIHHTRSLT